MKIRSVRCVIATIIITMMLHATNAQHIAEELYFEDAPPILTDEISPNVLLDESIEAQVNNKEPEIEPIIRPDMVPFNSKRIVLIKTLQTPPQSVLVNGIVVNLKNPARVADFYRLEQYPTIWTQENKVNNLVVQLQQAIEKSAEDALNPVIYHQNIIRFLTPETHYQDIIALEILMTDAWLSLADDLANGLVGPKYTSPTWNADKVGNDELALWLANGVVKKDVIQPLQAINGDDRHYQALRQIYNVTRAFNNTDDLVINMERIRWMPQNWHQQRYIVANIPAYEVMVVEKGKNIYRSRSVVGRKDRPTPRFVDQLRHVVLSPTWTVPPTIMKQDKLPRLRSNSSAFDGSFEAISPSGQVVKPSSVSWSDASARNYTLRQKSGRGNALGRVKFLFPNKHSIYMHDTPQRNLFNRAYRAKSSGCIRLQKPMELANLLLQGTSWSPAKIKSATGKRKTRWINAPELPVYMVYWTTWLDTDGTLHNSKDVYGLDAKLINAYKIALTQ